MTVVELDGEEQYFNDDVPGAQEEKRQKCLAQLVIACQKAAKVKNRRAAPKKEVKKLKEEIKEHLFQDGLERVKKLLIYMTTLNLPLGRFPHIWT
jgi:hypothetical protein